MNAKTRPRAARTARPEETLTVGDLVLEVLGRHGPATPAELIASVGAAPFAVIDATTRLFVAGVVRFTPDRQRFTLRGTR